MWIVLFSEVTQFRTMRPCWGEGGVLYFFVFVYHELSLSLLDQIHLIHKSQRPRRGRCWRVTCPPPHFLCDIKKLFCQLSHIPETPNRASKMSQQILSPTVVWTDEINRTLPGYDLHVSKKNHTLLLSRSLTHSSYLFTMSLQQAREPLVAAK